MEKRLPRQHFSCPNDETGKEFVGMLKQYLGPRYVLKVRGRGKGNGTGVYRYGIPLSKATKLGIYVNANEKQKSTTRKEIMKQFYYLRNRLEEVEKQLNDETQNKFYLQERSIKKTDIIIFLRYVLDRPLVRLAVKITNFFMKGGENK